MFDVSKVGPRRQNLLDSLRQFFRIKFFYFYKTFILSRILFLFNLIFIIFY